MRKIYIEKIAATKNGKPPIDKKDHIPGQIQWSGYSLPIEYNIEGYVYRDISVGHPVFVQRTKRNGVKYGGVFSSTKVLEINDSEFKTENSVYRYKYSNDKYASLSEIVSYLERERVDIWKDLSIYLGGDIDFEIDSRLSDLLSKLLNPEDLGYTVSPLIRDHARIVLGKQPCESALKDQV